ncbi:hypothetical protein [Agrobacterium sp. LMR679]|uniref:hypothetical protein n=1 Tax=Agrobacterium sp. LMR679 TaxID=3014335 RepID=UPI0022AF6777|nr:hypothetical protein [Agrobacterium sp. LMR679]MCZ4076315.1 hypothetical protein [Agrobacterium sp. LMR679]
MIVEFTLETGAIADSNVMQFVKGYEVSMAWGNEVDMMSPEVPGALFMRTGRYPPVKDIAPSELDRVSRDGREAMRRMGMTVDDTEITLPRMFWGDMNPPDVDHPLLKEVGWEDPDKKNPAYNFFRQPGGLDDGAENRVGRPRSAYEMDLRAMSENLSRRMVHGLPVTPRTESRSILSTTKKSTRRISRLRRRQVVASRSASMAAALHRRPSASRRRTGRNACWPSSSRNPARGRRGFR